MKSGRFARFPHAAAIYRKRENKSQLTDAISMTPCHRSAVCASSSVKRPSSFTNFNCAPMKRDFAVSHVICSLRLIECLFRWRETKIVFKFELSTNRFQSVCGVCVCARQRDRSNSSCCHECRERQTKCDVPLPLPLHRRCYDNMERHACFVCNEACGGGNRRWQIMLLLLLLM